MDPFDPPFRETYKPLFDNHFNNESRKGNRIVDLQEASECVYELPLIDLSRLNQGGIESEKCKQEIAKASQEWGFFQVINHGVSQEVLENMRSEQVKAFRKPFNDKVNGHYVLDFLAGSYQWGTPSATCLRQLAWSEAFHVPLTDISTIDGVTSLRYPSCPISTHVFGLMPHTDSDFLTILHQDHVGGLQLLKNGKWIAVNPKQEILIVIIGDLFQAWSNGTYKSVEHRVVANKHFERFSTAYFLCPSYDTIIESCDETPIYRRFTFKEFRQQVQEDVKTFGHKIGLSSQVKDYKIDLLVQQYKQFTILEEESIDSGFARFNTIITSLKALDEGFSSKNYDDLIGNLKVHEVVMEKDSEIYRGKKERVKSIALKAKKESSDDETSTSGSDGKEYVMAVRNFKKFFRRRVNLLGNQEKKRSHSDKGMRSKERMIRNALDAVNQIISLVIVQNHLVTKIKRHSLEVLGVIVKMTSRTKLTMKLVLWLNRQMRKIQNHLGSSIVAIRTDHGREFDNEIQFRAYCDAQGITHNFSTPRTPQSDGVVERKNRTLQEMSRTMLNEQSIPQNFWCNAVDTSTYIFNRILIRPILRKTPYEIFRVLNKHIMKVEESLNVTFDESHPPTKLSPLVDDDVGEEEAIENNTKVVNNSNEEDESIEADEVVNIKESKNDPL
ncbi:gibberellin 2-beta-dioxygenase 8-like protein [Tanacetum coccineum]|uniref:Gibberellin 2-beta-dioxygenase 8-like protein n=1 Tax=Tanacetum coccineum TaxID=301880 RepID=A0ABQ5EFY8_9ASTR